jgi:hypothetical protein
MADDVAVPSCATCDFYVAPHVIDRTVLERSGVVPKGFCQRYPQTLPKGPLDWCGEWREEKEPA